MKMLRKTLMIFGLVAGLSVVGLAQKKDDKKPPPKPPPPVIKPGEKPKDDKPKKPDKPDYEAVAVWRQEDSSLS